MTKHRQGRVGSISYWLMEFLIVKKSKRQINNYLSTFEEDICLFKYSFFESIFFLFPVMRIYSYT